MKTMLDIRLNKNGRVELYNSKYEGKYIYPAILDGKDCDLDEAISYMADNQSVAESSVVSGEKQLAFFFHNKLACVTYNRRTNVFIINLNGSSLIDEFVDLMEDVFFNEESELMNKFFFYDNEPDVIGVSVYFKPEKIE